MFKNDRINYVEVFSPKEFGKGFSDLEKLTKNRPLTVPVQTPNPTSKTNNSYRESHHTLTIYSTTYTFTDHIPTMSYLRVTKPTI